MSARHRCQHRILFGGGGVRELKAQKHNSQLESQ